MSTSSQPHLQIFSPPSSLALQPSQSSFLFFPLLPKEVRYLVWVHLLRRQRIIHVRLRARTSQTSKIHDFARDCSTQYIPIIDGYQTLSKLFRITTESRSAALSFYRVHVPCQLRSTIGLSSWEEGPTKPGTLYFNPELDFLKITSDLPVKKTLISFLYDLKCVYDPLRIGLLNLAVDLNDLNANDLYMLQPSDLSFAVHAAFVETLTQLHEVFFVVTERAGRQINGFFSGLLTSETMYNRSYPIMAMGPTFECLGPDPRPIPPDDLRKVFMGTSDPRHKLQLWHRLLTKWKISPTNIDYRLALAFDSTFMGDQVYDRQTAQRWLQKEDDIWTGVWQKKQEEVRREAGDDSLSGIRWAVGAEHEKFKNEDLEQAVKPAFGFWLFPVDAMGPLREAGVGDEEGFRSQPKQLADLTAYWPELALLSMPQ